MRDIPTWAMGPLVAAVEELSAEENAAARAILAAGEHVVEYFNTGGVLALAIDCGPLELLLGVPAELS